MPRQAAVALCMAGLAMGACCCKWRKQPRTAHAKHHQSRACVPFAPLTNAFSNRIETLTPWPHKHCPHAFFSVFPYVAFKAHNSHKCALRQPTWHLASPCCKNATMMVVQCGAFSALAPRGSPVPKSWAKVGKGSTGVEEWK